MNWPWKKPNPPESPAIPKDVGVSADLLERIHQNAQSPVASGWYETSSGSWVFLRCFFVYVGQGKVLWAVNVHNDQRIPIGSLAAAILETQIRRQLLNLRTAEEVAATHTASDTGKCSACGLARNHWPSFPCTKRKQHKKDE